MSLHTIWTLAQKELRDALRNRWFLLYTLAFLALALGLSALSTAGTGLLGFAGFGRTAASLVNLVLLMVPLMALTVGAQSLAGEEERRTLAYLLAQPLSRSELFIGKYLGLALGLLATLALGFGLAGTALGLQAGGDPLVYLALVGLAFLLALVMLSTGFLISAWSRRTGVAVGIGLFLWLFFVFLGDLGMMGTAIVLRLPVNGLLWLALANPLQLFKLAAIAALQTNLEMLGPAGIYATQTYGDALWLLLAALLALWVLLPALAALARFVSRSNIEG
jgi:Cu-processing system permease protein